MKDAPFSSLPDRVQRKARGPVPGHILRLKRNGNSRAEILESTNVDPRDIDVLYTLALREQRKEIKGHSDRGRALRKDPPRLPGCPCNGCVFPREVMTWWSYTGQFF